MQSANTVCTLGLRSLRNRDTPARGAAGAHRRDERIYGAFGLLPDFGPVDFVVGKPVGGIVELIGPDAIRQLCGEAPSLFLVVHLVAVRHGGYHAHLCAQCAQDVYFLLGLVVWHVDDAR